LNIGVDTPLFFFYDDNDAGILGRLLEERATHERSVRRLGVKDLHIQLRDLIFPLSRTMDMMSPAVGEHNLLVAYLSLRLCEALGFSPEMKSALCIAGALHDIGAFSLQDRLDLLDFEETRSTEHSMAGYLLLRGFKPFEGIATIIRHHHLPWRSGEGRFCEGQPVPEGSHIIHLADRAAVLISKDRPVLSQVQAIYNKIEKQKDAVFVPQYVDALKALTVKDYIWLDIASGAMESVLYKNIGTDMAQLDVNDLLEFSKIICRIIDFKSHFTATHSSGVAAVAVAMAKLAGFSEEEYPLFAISACLHDLGKLAIPSEILEKPGKLTPEEWDIMRSHVYYTYRALAPIESLHTVATWGAFHQERLDGSGYPFSYAAGDLNFGTRIMAMADVFTGITEDRPYRKGMSRDEAVALLKGLARDNKLDKKLVDLLMSNYEEVNDVRVAAQEQAANEYREFREALKTGLTPL